MSYSNFQFIIDISTLTVLITLAVYHFAIYWRRKDYSEEQYNLYFSLFSILLASYLFFESPMFVLKIVFDYGKGDWIPAAEGLAVLGIFFSFTKFFSRLLYYPLQKEKYLWYAFIFLAASLSLTMLSLFKGWDWYNTYAGNYVISLTTIYTLFIAYQYGRWIFKNEFYKQPNFQIMVIGVTVLVFFLLSIKIIEMFYSPVTFRGMNFVITGIVFLFAYILTEKFNIEFEELVLLKNNLEEKIKERTAELTRAKEEIEDAKEEIEFISRERADFFINLAHETKTPLTIISNYLDKYIRTYGTNEEIGIIKRNIDKLCKDMVNFLDQEKLIKGQVTFGGEQAVNFTEYLKDRILLLKEYARSRNIQLDYSIDGIYYVMADPHIIDGIILNLIENACKYTPSGGEINVKLTSDENNLLFMVADTGIGIPEEKLSHIFEPYYQASHKKSNVQGMGMGLYIVKRSVEFMDGSISVKSAENKGSIFTVTLPMCEAPAEEKDIIKKPGVPLTGAKKIMEPQFDSLKESLLLVEDNIDMSGYLIEELSGEYNIFHASDGIEALNKINNIPVPALIISDIMMDKMDGEELYNKISSNECFRNIPFIFLTALNEQDKKIKLLQSGVIDYISKPFNIVELKAKIETIIDNAHRQKMDGLQQAVEAVTSRIKNPQSTRQDKNIIFEERCIHYSVTGRQKEIIALVAEGLEYKEIAALLNISDKTVFRHIDMLFKKLDVHNKIDLINKMYR